MKFFNFFNSNKKIKATTFNTEQFQKEILEKATNWYFESKQNYELTAKKLTEEGLDKIQVENIIEKLKTQNQKRSTALSEEMNSGKIAVKIKPIEGGLKPEQKTKEVVDQYIGFGAFQMDNGDLENALELFNKAIDKGG